MNTNHKTGTVKAGAHEGSARFGIHGVSDDVGVVRADSRRSEARILSFVAYESWTCRQLGEEQSRVGAIRAADRVG
jgi:hypothetical protein